MVPEELTAKVDELTEAVRYLEYENSRMSALLRYLTAESSANIPLTEQTKESFDFQWEKRIPRGRYMLDNPQFREEAPNYVLEFTQLPRDWFAGKKVVDVGCGKGRYSWALSQLGADVLSLDQSPNGLEITAEACKEFPNHRTKRVDLLKPLQIDEQFDLVWSFGVLHHTGDTYGAFKNVLPLVKPGGLLFLMLYGEPRMGIASDYAAVNEYEVWRHKTKYLSYNDKLDLINEGMMKQEFRADGQEYVHDYFDAISPNINDLYSWSELMTWLTQEGFENIQRTVDTRNHHLIARKPLA